MTFIEEGKFKKTLIELMLTRKEIVLTMHPLSYHDFKGNLGEESILGFRLAFLGSTVSMCDIYK